MFLKATIIHVAFCNNSILIKKVLNKEKNIVYWHKLLHYHRSYLGKFKSLADGSTFFFDPNGKNDPHAELLATIKAFENPQAKLKNGLHPQCAFPERYRFLKNLGLIKAKDKICPDFLEWKKKINAHSMTLVFSTAFANNPSSMFGHTFIRFNRPGKKNDLLDYGASYSAFVEQTDWGISYAFKGLTGRYKGYFSFAPYYMKVNEYKFSESRDLFEYDLNIPKNRVERVINHLWEIYANTWFDYYFLDENCSYLLGEIIEVAMPEWNITNNRRWYYLPSDLIKEIIKIEDSIKRVHFRPSLRKELKAMIDRLDHNEKKTFDKLRKKRTSIQDIKDEKIFDTLIKYFNFKKHKKRGEIPLSDKQYYRKILLARSKISTRGHSDVPQDKLLYDQSNRPDKSHNPSKLSLAIGKREDFQFTSIKFKNGYHDLLASDIGMEPFSQFDYFGIELEYNDFKKKVMVSKIDLINIVSLHRMTFYDPQASWAFQSGLAYITDLDSIMHRKWFFEGGPGITLELGHSKALFYLIVGGFFETSKLFKKSFRVGPYFEWSLLSEIKSFYKIQFSQNFHHDIKSGKMSDYYIATGLSHSFHLKDNWEIRFHSKFYSKYQSIKRNIYEHKLIWAHYF